MKYIGYLFTIGGVVGVIYTAINYINESDTFSFLGIDVAVSKGDPMPVIISAIILIAGLLIVRASKNS